MDHAYTPCIENPSLSKGLLGLRTKPMTLFTNDDICVFVSFVRS